MIFLIFQKLKRVAPLESINFDPEILSYNVCDLITPKTANKPVEILCSVNENVPVELIGDPHRLRQVITNLMGNASKFTENDEIELSLDVEQEKENKIKLHFKSGIQVLESAKNNFKIFLRFSHRQMDLRQESLEEQGLV